MPTLLVDLLADGPRSTKFEARGLELI